jgi:hypothetical protein
VKRRLGEQSERIAAGDRRRERPSEPFIDDEPRVVTRHVQFAEDPDVRGDVDSAVAVGEDGVYLVADGGLVDGSDVRVEQVPEGRPRGIDRLDDGRGPFPDPVPLRADALRREAHTVDRPAGGNCFAKAFITAEC